MRLPIRAPNTIATGRMPQDHGIPFFSELDPRNGMPKEGGLPYTSECRRVPAIWNLAGDAGLDVLSVGWWVSWPAEAVKNGRIEQENFHDYGSMRIAQMPKVETIVMPSGGFWGGVGEPTICVAAPAVLNAIAAATGKRIRTFPLKNHGVQMV